MAQKNITGDLNVNGLLNEGGKSTRYVIDILEPANLYYETIPLVKKSTIQGLTTQDAINSLFGTQFNVSGGTNAYLLAFVYTDEYTSFGPGWPYYRLAWLVASISTVCSVSIPTSTIPNDCYTSNGSLRSFYINGGSVYKIAGELYTAQNAYNYNSNGSSSSQPETSLNNEFLRKTHTLYQHRITGPSGSSISGTEIYLYSYDSTKITYHAGLSSAFRNRNRIRAIIYYQGSPKTIVDVTNSGSTGTLYFLDTSGSISTISLSYETWTDVVTTF